MLMLARKKGQAVQIGDDIVVKVVESGRGQVKLLFSAPRHVPIMRQELVNKESRNEPDAVTKLGHLGA